MNAWWNKRRLFLGAVILVAIFALCLCWTPVRIQYHRSFVADSRRPLHERPTRFRDYLSMRTLFWIVRGLPAAEMIIKVGEEHEEALVQMGYFDRRHYQLTNVNRGKFISKIRELPVKDRLWFCRFDLGESLEVVAQRDDFAKIELIIESFGGQR